MSDDIVDYDETPLPNKERLDQIEKELATIREIIEKNHKKQDNVY